MRILDSRLYRVAEVATNYLLLNLLWLIASLPLVTLFPATTALFGVLRTWEEREGAGVVGPFFAAFREKFWQSQVLGFTWAAIGGVLFVDLLASRRVVGALAFPLLVAAGGMALVYCLLTVYLFPVIANARTSPRGVIKNAGLLVLSQPIASLVAAFALLAAGLVVYLAPFVVLFSGSIIARGLDALFRRGVGKFVPPSVDAAEGIPLREGAGE